MNEWHQVHDFCYGFGMMEFIPDNETVLEDHSDESIPWQIVNTSQPAKHVWLQDTRRWLGITTEIFTMTSEELYGIYDKLQPFMEAEAERILANFSKISIPKIKAIYPQSVIRELCRDNEITRS